MARPSTFESTAAPTAHDPYAALRFRDFRLLTIGKLAASLGEQMVGVAVGWELYERTASPLALGLVGLVQVLPVILLALHAGHVADRFDRRRVVFVAQGTLALCSFGLALLSLTQGALILVYACLLGIGVARAFNNPASAALLPQTVPQAAFTNAATWSSSSWQLAAVLGPALGGILIALRQSAVPIYLLNTFGCLTFVVLVRLIQGKQTARTKEPATFKTLAAGAGFILRSKVILATITLDLFAVLLGGAVALMPVFAKDILHAGPTGLGWMRAAPSIGALLMAVIIAHRPPFRRAGYTMLWAVAGFGFATIVFGISTTFLLSVLMLGLLGALDQISVVVRSTLLLTRAPDEVRGRVYAVNSVFVGASNELGAFESGLAAALFGPIFAVVSGGIGTILVVLTVMRIWPEVRQLGRLDER